MAREYFEFCMEWTAAQAVLENESARMSLFEAVSIYVANGGCGRFLTGPLAYFGLDFDVGLIDDTSIVNGALATYPNAAPATRQRQFIVPTRAILNAARGRARAVAVDRVRKRWLAPEEFERFAAVAATPERFGLEDPERHLLRNITFLAGTGVCPGEMFAIDRSDIHHDTREVLIRGREPGAGKTAFRSRMLCPPGRVWSLLDRVPDEGRAFRDQRGRPYQLRDHGGGQMKTAFSILRAAAGLDADVTPYTLRHTWATWYYAQTLDLRRLQEYGGWGRTDTAFRYTKLAPRDLGDRLLQHGWDFGQDPGNS